MSLIIPFNFLSRQMFNVDPWFTQSHLDIFDPFDDLDRVIGRNLTYLDTPGYLPIFEPRVPNKYRVAVDCAGYKPSSIKTEIKDGQLLVLGKEGDKQNEEKDFSIKEFKKTYKLPENIEAEKMVSFMTSNGKLIVEIPLKEDKSHKESLQFPRIVDDESGNKSVSMKVSVPENIDPSKITVTCKDRDVIIKAEDKTENPDGMTNFYYYRRSTLPENTDLSSLKCVYDNNQLSISAPVNLNNNQSKTIPVQIEAKKSIK